MTSQTGPLDRTEVVRSVQRLSTAAMHFSDRAGAGAGLHRSDLQALQALAAAREAGEGSLTPGELAQKLGLSPSATTSLVDRLERVGHARRVRDDADRRRVGVEMTASAGREARALFGPLAGAMLAMMEDFDDAELRVVQRFLSAAAETVEESADRR